MSAVPTLETERLRLRGFGPDDFETYARWCGDAETMRFIGEGKPVGRDDAWRSLAVVMGHWPLRGYGLWAAEEKASGALIGRIGLYEPEGWPGLEVGWLVDRERWGEGFAPEGAAAALHHAFTVLSVPRLISLIQPDNAPSIRVAEKLGERYDGQIEVSGALANVYAIGRETWRSTVSSP